jgi:hypothetical protein
VVNRDIATVLLRAFADAHPLSPRGVKEALERVKMIPAAAGAPGTRISFGKWTRRAWMGAGYLGPAGSTRMASIRISSIASVRNDTMAIRQTFLASSTRLRTEAVAWMPCCGSLVGHRVLVHVIAYSRAHGRRLASHRQPGACGASARPWNSLWRSDTAWIVRHQVGCVVMMLVLIAACVRTWLDSRRTPTS